MVDMVRSADSEALLEAIRDFADKQIRPAVLAGRGALGSIAAGLHAMGIASPVPEELGGQGLLSRLDLAVVAEELARADAGVAFDIMAGRTRQPSSPGAVPTPVAARWPRRASSRSDAAPSSCMRASAGRRSACAQPG